MQSILYDSTNYDITERRKRLCQNVQRYIHHCSEGMVSYESESLGYVFV